MGYADPKLTATITGLVEGDDESLITYELTRTGGQAVGNYIIRVTGEEEQGNYKVTFRNGRLSIREENEEEETPLGMLGTASLYFLSDTLVGSEGARADAFDTMIQWIAEHNGDALNALAVINSGSLVADVKDEAAWKRAKDALNKLPGSLPFFGVAGSRDVHGDELDYDAYLAQDPCMALIANSYENGRLWFHPFTQQQLLLVGIGYQKAAETDEELEQQKQWLAFLNNTIAAYEEYTVVLLVNDFLELGENEGESQLTAFGELLEKNVVAPNANVELILCGNGNGAARWEKAYGQRTVDALMFNYQADEENGLGFLRIITFSNTDDGRNITVTTYSPVLDKDSYDEDHPEYDYFVIKGAF